jgi:hypothetical protein
LRKIVEVVAAATADAFRDVARPASARVDAGLARKKGVKFETTGHRPP